MRPAVVTSIPSRDSSMNEADLFPDELRVTDDLDWVYTTSRKVAQYFDLPHEEVIQRILKLTDGLSLKGSEVNWEIFRFGVLMRGHEEKPCEIDNEWLLGCDIFWVLVADFFGDRADTPIYRRLVDKIDQIQQEMNQLKAAQS